MPKSPDAFRTISEVASALDVPQHVLRFWETKFSQIKPLKRAGGRRYYRPADVELIRGIQALLYGEGYTIKGVQRILKDQGVRYVLETGRHQGDQGEPIATSSGGKAIDTETGKDELPVPDAHAEAKPAAIASSPNLSDGQRAHLSDILKDLVALKSRISDIRALHQDNQDMPLLAQMRGRD